MALKEQRQNAVAKEWLEVRRFKCDLREDKEHFKSDLRERMMVS